MLFQSNLRKQIRKVAENFEICETIIQNYSLVSLEVKEDFAARSAGLPARLDEIHAAFAEVASLLEKGTSSGPVPVPIPTPRSFRDE